MEIRIGNIAVKLEIWKMSVTVMNERLAPWLLWKSGFHVPTAALRPVVLQKQHVRTKHNH